MTIAFNGATRSITLSSGTITMSVRDLWSRWVDWWLTDDNSKYGIWMVNLGGDDVDITQGTSVPIYLFLETDVKIKPQEADHTLAVTDGVLVVSGGGDPFADTTGDYTVRINYQQPVQALTVTAGSGVLPSDVTDITTSVWAAAQALFLNKVINNKREIKKTSGVWYLIVYDDDDTTPIVTKALKDVDGNNISDLTAGLLASEGPSSV
jgi:hypothetical protein